MFSFTWIDLTFEGVLKSLPIEPGSIFAFILILLFVGLTLWGSRPKTSVPPAGANEGPEAAPTADVGERVVR
jgi:hypothetical protein